jgi:hypothetical protein
MLLRVLKAWQDTCWSSAHWAEYTCLAPADLAENTSEDFLDTGWPSAVLVEETCLASAFLSSCTIDAVGSW